jgi:hypothetical protein
MAVSNLLNASLLGVSDCVSTATGCGNGLVDENLGSKPGVVAGTIGNEPESISMGS